MEANLMLGGIVWFLFSLLIGVIGSDREIGFMPVFILSLIFSPLAGLLFAFGSRHKKDAEFQRKVLESLNKATQ